MPTVLRVAGFAVRIFPNDHRPPHVHVFNGAGVARVGLCGEDGPRLLTVVEMKRSDAARAEAIVREYAGLLLAEWEAIHGR